MMFFNFTSQKNTCDHHCGATMKKKKKKKKREIREGRKKVEGERGGKNQTCQVHKDRGNISLKIQLLLL